MNSKLQRGLLALTLALSLGSTACGDDGESGSGDNAPDLDNNGDNNANNSGGTNNGSTNDGENNGASTGDSNTGSTGDDDCVKAPKTSADFLNSCPPKGVARGEFDNAERLPSTYKGPGEPLPDLP